MLLGNSDRKVLDILAYTYTAVCRARHADPTLHTAYCPSPAVAQSGFDQIAAPVDSSPTGRIATRTIACLPQHTSLYAPANHLLQSHILIAVIETPYTSHHSNLDTITQHHPRASNSASRLHHTHPSAGQRPQERHIRPLAPREKAKKWFPCPYSFKKWSQLDQEKTSEEEIHPQSLIYLSVYFQTHVQNRQACLARGIVLETPWSHRLMGPSSEEAWLMAFNIFLYQYGLFSSHCKPHVQN
jgi:hypothetical protein